MRHGDEAGRTRDTAVDALVVSLVDQGDGAKEIEQEQDSLAREGTPWLEPAVADVVCEFNERSGCMGSRFSKYEMIVRSSR